MSFDKIDYAGEKRGFDEFDYADNRNDEKRMLDAELEGEEELKDD